MRCSAEAATVTAFGHRRDVSASVTTAFVTLSNLLRNEEPDEVAWCLLASLTLAMLRLGQPALRGIDANLWKQLHQWMTTVDFRLSFDQDPVPRQLQEQHSKERQAGCIGVTDLLPLVLGSGMLAAGALPTEPNNTRLAQLLQQYSGKYECTSNIRWDRRSAAHGRDYGLQDALAGSTEKKIMGCWGSRPDGADLIAQTLQRHRKRLLEEGDTAQCLRVRRQRRCIERVGALPVP